MKKNSIITILTIAVAMPMLFLFAPYLSQANETEEVKLAGDPRGFGERRSVTTHEEARTMIREHFSTKDVTIGEIIEKELFFKAEIRGKDGTLIDKIIIDKRTGRVRSIY